MTLSEILGLFQKDSNGNTVLKISAGGTGNTAGGDGAGGGSAKQIVSGSAGTVSSGNTGYYNPFTVNAVPSNADMSDSSQLIYNEATLISSACTIKNLRVKTRANGTGESVTITLMKNGSPTTLTVTVSNDDETGADTTHEISVSAGDMISLKVVLSAGASRNPLWSLEIDVA